MHITTLFSLILFLQACGPDFDTAFETEHFVYHVQEGADAPCADLGVWLERHYAAISTFFNVSLDSGKKIHYYRYKSADDAADNIDGCNTGCCAFNREIHCNHEVIIHELVHTISYLRSKPPIFFREGIANVLGCVSVDDDIFYGPQHRNAPVSELLVQSQFEKSTNENGIEYTYPVAQSFVRFLIEHNGRDTFIALYKNLKENAESDEISEAFATYFGLSPATLVDEWRAQPSEYYQDTCLYPIVDQIDEIVTDEPTVLHPSCTTGPRIDVHETMFSFYKDDNPAIIDVLSNDRKSIEFLRPEGGSITSGLSIDLTEIVIDNTVSPSKLIAAPGQKGSRIILDAPSGEYLASIWGEDATDVTIYVHSETADISYNECDDTQSAIPVSVSPGMQVIYLSRWIDSKNIQTFEWNKKPIIALKTESPGLLSANPFMRIYPESSLFHMASPANCSLSLDECVEPWIDECFGVSCPIFVAPCTADSKQADIWYFTTSRETLDQMIFHNQTVNNIPTNIDFFGYSFKLTP